MPRNDPTDTGGLFIGRRPGTAPLHYRAAPQIAGEGRRRADATLANIALAVEILLCVSLWGPQPAVWLWFGSHVDYWTGSVTAGIVSAFAGMVASLMLTLAVAARVDRIWRLLRRAAGHDQREGALGRIFAATAVVAALGFCIWFLIIQGPGPSLSSMH